MADFEDLSKAHVRNRRMTPKEEIPEKTGNVRGDFFVVAEGQNIQSWTKDDCFRLMPKMINFMKGQK